MATSERGFHRTRVAEAGFPLHNLRAWREALALWKEQHPSEVDKFETMLSEFRARWDDLVRTIGGH